MQQESLLINLSSKFEEQNALLEFKENEIKELELKLMRFDALSSRNKSH